ncbi:methyl-accepting chemotaxis protein [Massilia sp. DD77]|uniref:methyl-accepting chemotaxis protein n=1 Tax=Massilia sp. DD77 TaxID=3109349 RepID=UPI00300071CD
MIPKNPTLGVRLAFSYGAVFLLLILLTALAMLRVGQIKSVLDQIDDNKIKLRYASELRASVHDRATALRDVVLSADAAAATAPISLIRSLEDSYARSAEPLATLFQELPGVLPEEKEALAAILSQESRARPLIGRVIELHAAGQVEEARALLAQQAAPALVDWSATVKRFIDLEEKLNDEMAGDARRTGEGFFGWIAQLCALAIGAAALAAWYLARGLRQAGQPDGAAVATAPDASRDGKGAALQVRPAFEPAPEAADQIAGLIGTIDAIAFQSHILALNTAVEAARAGEEGRECAVEASEAHALALRSASAARDIRALIGSPAERVGA